jgi:pectate lyase
MTFHNLLVQVVALAAFAGAQAPVDQLVGYGAGTTGGGSGSGTTVTSCSQLESAIDNGGVIRVNGMLSGCGILRPQSDTSIIGVGSNSGRISFPMTTFI